MAHRILHIIPALDRCGAAKRLALLATGIDASEFELHVCALSRGGPFERELKQAGISTIVFQKRWSCDPVALGQLVGLLRRLRPKLVHTWQPDGAEYGRLGKTFAGVPHLVVDMSGTNGHEVCLSSTFSRRLARQADRLVASGAALCGLQHSPPAGRWEVISNGVPPARPSDRTRSELLAELDLPPAARLIGAIGRHVPQRRTTDLIWAADLLRVLHDNMRLLVIGDGPERPQLERFARLASDLDHIRFLGQRDDLWRILPHMDVLWQEGTSSAQPQIVMEAMAAAVPVVASDTPAHRELVIHGQTGYLVPVAGRAARVRFTDRILNDRELAQQFGAAARRRMIDQFPLQSMVEAYAQLYRDVLSA